jgi:hypothetical protein
MSDIKHSSWWFGDSSWEQQLGEFTHNAHEHAYVDEAPGMSCSVTESLPLTCKRAVN